MPLGVSSLLQFLVVLLDTRFAVILERTIPRKSKSALSLLDIRKEAIEISRHLSIMLDLIFELRQLLNDRFSFFALLLVGDIGDGPVQVVDSTGLIGVLY